MSQNQTSELSSRHHQVDAEVGNALIEVKLGATSLRTMGGALMKLVSELGSRPGYQGYLALVDAALSLPRLQSEWSRLSRVFRPEIMKRLSLCLVKQNEVISVPEILAADVRKLILEVVAGQHGNLKSSQAPRASEAFYNIVRVLLLHCFRRSGPLTTKQLIAETGFSYPTIQEAVERLRYHVRRHSDRRVEMVSFPRDAWFELLAKSGKVRFTQGYIDRSGRPRSIDNLLDRLRELNRDDIAIGGAIGARHYVPGIDLIGIPRLDIALHSPGKPANYDFLRRLDPALKPVELGELPCVVIHTLHRPESFFEVSEKGGLPFADEVECLLDLHEMRLEAQALEFVDNRIRNSQSPA